MQQGVGALFDLVDEYSRFGGMRCFLLLFLKSCTE